MKCLCVDLLTVILGTVEPICAYRQRWMSTFLIGIYQHFVLHFKFDSINKTIYLCYENRAIDKTHWKPTLHPMRPETAIRLRYTQRGRRQQSKRAHVHYMLQNKTRGIHSEYEIFHTVYGNRNYSNGSQYYVIVNWLCCLGFSVLFEVVNPCA